jgi:ketosteroid isomerase-like protein
MKIRLFVKCIIVALTLCSYTSFAQKLQVNEKNEKIVRQVYAAYEKKDWHMLEAIFADGFTFTSPAGDDHINLKVYKERCWPNANNLKKFELKNVIVDGNDAFVLYNAWNNEGKSFRNTEHFKLKDGKIVEMECFFGIGIGFPNSGK